MGSVPQYLDKVAPFSLFLVVDGARILVLFSASSSQHPAKEGRETEVGI